MPSRPLIGITLDHNTRLTTGDSGASSPHTQYTLPHSYSLAIEAAGGLPVLLPYRCEQQSIDDYADLCDGFVFSGGNDYDPAAFGQERHKEAHAIDPDRETFDRAMLKAAEKSGKPILGICGGCQLMNLVRGGSLHQFIPELPGMGEIEHRRFSIEEWSKRHATKVESSSALARHTASIAISVNSSHKQAVDRLGKNLVITARAPDGTVEAIEDPKKPFYIGVQWHPERQHDEPAQRALFRAFVDACRERM